MQIRNVSKKMNIHVLRAISSKRILCWNGKQTPLKEPFKWSSLRKMNLALETIAELNLCENMKHLEQVTISLVDMESQPLRQFFDCHNSLTSVDIEFTGEHWHIEGNLA